MWVIYNHLHNIPAESCIVISPRRFEKVEHNVCSWIVSRQIPGMFLNTNSCLRLTLRQIAGLSHAEHQSSIVLAFPWHKSSTYRFHSKMCWLEVFIDFRIQQRLSHGRSRWLRDCGAQAIEHASKEASVLLGLLLRWHFKFVTSLVALLSENIKSNFKLVLRLDQSRI